MFPPPVPLLTQAPPRVTAEALALAQVVHVVREFFSEYPGRMAAVASAKAHARRAQSILLRDGMASWLKASRAAWRVWGHIQLDPLLEPLMGP